MKNRNKSTNVYNQYCKLVKPALHLMFAGRTRRGRLSSPEPPEVERNAGFTGGLNWCTSLSNHAY